MRWVLVQTNGEAFDSEAYSRMKHGVITDTQAFASLLASTLCNEVPDVVYAERAPSLVVAYEALPHAATILAGLCLRQVNLERQSVGRPPGNLLRIHTTDYMEPYSHYPTATREEILHRQVGKVKSRHADGGHLVIIDDIRVTGSQERWFSDVLASHTKESMLAAYIASFVNGAPESPELEGQLDNASIQTLYDLLPHIADGNVRVTHKLARDLLLTPLDELPSLLDCLPAEMIQALTEGIRAMASDTLSPYQANYQLILARHNRLMATQT